MTNEGQKKLSGGDAARAATAKRFLRQAGITTKNFRIFGSSHPVLQNNIHNSYESLKPVLETRNSVTFTFAEGASLVEEIPLTDADPKVYSFLEEAHACGITSLTFLEGMTEWELGAVLKLISGGPAAIKAENGLTDFLQRKNIATIKTDEVFFKKVTKREEEAGEARKHLEDFLVVNYLLGKSSISGDEIKTLSGEVRADPSRMGHILSGLASSGTARGEAGGAAEFIHASIEKLAGHMQAAHEKGEAEIQEDIARLILALEPEVRNDFLLAEAHSTAGTGDLIKRVLAELSDAIIIDLIVSDFLDRGSSLVEVKKLIARLLPDEPKRNKVLPLLAQRFAQRGVPEETRSKLLYEKFWSDMDDEEKVKKILSEQPSYCAEIGMQEMEALIGGLLAERQFGAVSSVAQKIVSILRSKDFPLTPRLMHDLGKLMITLFECGEYQDRGTTLERFVQEFKKIREKDLREEASRMLGAVARLCVTNRWYAHLPLLISAVGYDILKRDILASDMRLETFLETILSDALAPREALKGIAQAAGEEGRSALRTLLISIVPDDFDSYKKRHELIRVLKELGDGVEDFLTRNLSSQNIDVVKNSLEALSEIGTADAVPAIEALLAHKNTRIREHATIALRNIAKRR